MSEPAESVPVTFVNPFPAAAVARLSQAKTDYITILTPGLATALSYTDAYLARINDKDFDDANPDSSGNIIAIVGEYGTGKTHLALAILNQIHRFGSDAVHSVYLDAPADTFLALYKDRFIVKLSRVDVQQRVADYYADIVADELAGSELTSDLAERLRAREIRADTVVRNLGLMESEFMQELRHRLSTITERKEFGTVLALFLRPEFEATVWDWLAGNPPDPTLVERGITTSIDSDSSALEAMGVFAFLYGHQRHRFVLVVDELEKVLSTGSAHRPDDSAILAFKKLLEIFARTRALLVLSGLPDFLDALPEDARQRIGCLVRPTPMQKDDTIRYVEESQRMVTGKRQLKPFNIDVIGYLVDLAGGNPRKIIRLCYHAYQAALSTGTDVSRAIVREAAKDQFELVTSEDVRSEIRRVLDINGWLFEQDHHLEKGKASRVDFWLPIGNDGAGCAVILTSSVLHEPDANQLAQRARAIMTERTKSRLVLLVVNGYLAENLANPVKTSYARVLIHSARRFEDELSAALTGLRQRIENIAQANVIELLRARVDQISRQSTSALTLLNTINERMVDALTLQHAIESSVNRKTEGITGDEADLVRHPVLEFMFEQALQSIRRITSPLNEVMQAAFDITGSRPRSSIFNLPPGFLSILARDPSISVAVGMTDILEQTVLAFRSAAAEYVTVMYLVDVRSYRYRADDLCKEFESLVRGVAKESYPSSFHRLANLLLRASPTLGEHDPFEFNINLLEKMIQLKDEVYEFLASSEREHSMSRVRRAERNSRSSTRTVRTVLAIRSAGRRGVFDHGTVRHPNAKDHPQLDLLFEEVLQPLRAVTDQFNAARRLRFERIIDDRGIEFDGAPSGLLGVDDPQTRETIALMVFLKKIVLAFRNMVFDFLSTDQLRSYHASKTGDAWLNFDQLSGPLINQLSELLPLGDFLPAGSIFARGRGSDLLRALESLGPRTNDLVNRDRLI